MNTRTLQDVLSRHCPKDFLGVYPSDLVPARARKGWLVANLDESDEPGSHWVTVGCNEFFDSYAQQPQSYFIIRYLRACPRKPWINRTRLQKWNSTVCGHYCIYYILKRCEGKRPQQIIDHLIKQNDSDAYVLKFVNKLL